MWRYLFYTPVLFLVLVSLFGCGPSVAIRRYSSGQVPMSQVSSSTPAMPVVTAEVLTDQELANLSLMPSGKPIAGLPFVRSQPKPVAPFPLVLNRTVQSYIDSYLARPETLRLSFERSSPFMREMISVFEDNGLPPDLVYLAFAESAFTPGGAGPWQLSRATARRYGLKMNQWLDERRDPIKSTEAAASYLAELHDQTPTDWRMTLVAWNNGDEGVYRYLQLVTVPYEQLMQRLPRRTRTLMNRFMAVALIAHHPKRYGLESVCWTSPRPYKVIAVKGGTPLWQIAKSNHTAVETLRQLNPALLSDRTPPGPRSYPIRIPDNSSQTKPALSDS
jgi:membrane-bound lytic murein transglycosylase D